MVASASLSPRFFLFRIAAGPFPIAAGPFPIAAGLPVLYTHLVTPDHRGTIEGARSATSERLTRPFRACGAAGRWPASSQCFLRRSRAATVLRMLPLSVLDPRGSSSTKSHTGSRDASLSTVVMLGLVLVRLAPVGGAHAADRLDKNSWSALAAGATEVRGRADRPSDQCARVYRSTCSNVDVPCSDESPVYRLDTETKVPGKSGRYCWPSLFNFGQATKE